MAVKNNPFLNIDKLRQAPGEAEVIPAGSYDQYEPATSYKLGPSTMSVDMTPGDWPNTGKGVVNTDRASDIFATQMFQPFGSDIVYNRRWDDTPLDFSDDFTDTNGSLPDTDKWDLGTGLTVTDVQIQNNSLRLGTLASTGWPGVVGKYNFAGDFDVAFDATTTYAMTFYFEIVPASPSPYDFSSTGNPGTIQIKKLPSSGNYQVEINGVQTTFGQDDWKQRLRVVRNGATDFIEVYSAPINTDNWTLRASGTHAALNGTGRPRIFTHYPNNYCFIDNYILTDSVLNTDVPATAHWSNWLTQKDYDVLTTETNTYSDTVVNTHNDSTNVHGFDLATFATSTEVIQNAADSTAYTDSQLQNHIDTTVAHGIDAADYYAHVDSTVAHGFDLSTFSRTDNSIVTNQLQLDTTSLIKITQDSTVYDGWEDYTTDIIIRTDQVAINKPAWTLFRNNIYGFAFDPTTLKEFFANVHVKHDYALGTSIFPHVHWSTGNSTEVAVVRWGFEWTYAQGHGQAAYGDTTTVYVDTTTNGVAYTHYVSEVSLADAIDVGTLEPDGIILFRVFRDAANANDTFTSNVWAWTFDAHYQKNRFATLNKAPNFYG